MTFLNQRGVHYFLLFTLFVFSFSPATQAQKLNEDSLQNLIRQTDNDTVKIDALMTLANYQIKHKRQDSAGLATLETAKAIADRINYQPGMIQYLLTTGNYYRSKNNWVQSMEAYNKMIGISTSVTNDSIRQKSLMMAYNNLGGIYNFNGDFQQSLNYRLKALDIVEKQVPVNYNNLAIVYLNIASDYRQLKVLPKGIEYLNRTRPFFNELNSRLKMEFYFEYFENFYEADSSQSAKRMLINIKDGLAKFDLSDFQKMDYSYMLQKLSGLYALNIEANADSGIGYFNQALLLAKELDSKVDVTESLYNIGTAFVNKKDFKKAEGYLQEAYDSASNNSLKNQSLKIVELLAQCYNATGKPALAYQKMQEALTLQSEIYNEDQTAQLNFLEARYQYEKKEKEIVGLKLFNASQALEVIKRNRFLLFGGIVSVALLIILGLLYRSSRQKAIIEQKEKLLKDDQIKFLERQQQVVSLQSMVNGQETERSRIARDLHDGLGGLFSTIKMQLSTIKHQEKALEHNELFQKSYELVDNASVEVRRIAHNMMPEVLIKLGLLQAVQEICNSINAGKLLQVSMQAYGMEKRLNPSTEVMLFRIIQELMNNIIKHAQATEAIIQFNNDGNRLSVTVEDNGRGFSPRENGTNHAGLESVKSRVNYLNGQLSIDSEKEVGTTVLMEFLVNE